MDFSNVIDQEDAAEADGDLAALTNTEGSSLKAVPTIWSEVMRFLTNLSRPDPKKNITTLVKAFGECRPLQELANLTLIMENRDDIDEMSGGNANVLTAVLKLVDKYDLYGGVFINPALVEPFRLTLIEFTQANYSREDIDELRSEWAHSVSNYIG